MEKITAKQAINRECRDCCNTTYWKSVCNSDTCALSEAREFKTAVRRIKAHCIECNTQKTVYGVAVCGGDKLIGGATGQPHICHLFPFREGKNPYRAKRVYSDADKAAFISKLSLARGVRKPQILQNEV